MSIRLMNAAVVAGLVVAGGLPAIAAASAATQPIASSSHAPSASRSTATSPLLKQAVAAYATYVDHNIASLISHTKTFCASVDMGKVKSAERRYPHARVYYERIEPVAAIWGNLDTQIDGRWQNPVTNRKDFIGFHRIEQLLWTDKTTTGATALCRGLIQHERQLKALVSKVKYRPIQLASGATDLIDEASTSKITGEEERYSDVDFVVFVANIQAAQEVVKLFTPYLNHGYTNVETHIASTHAAVMKLLKKYQRTPGYDHTGYANYRTVTNRERRALSGAVNAYAEALASLTSAVSTPA
jgi:iron uptake system component EfeO